MINTVYKYTEIVDYNLFKLRIHLKTKFSLNSTLTLLYSTATLVTSSSVFYYFYRPSGVSLSIPPFFRTLG